MVAESIHFAALAGFQSGAGPQAPVRVLADARLPGTHVSESGQSVIEFLLMLPLMLGLTVLLVRMNSVIQVSIVNQQYARAQTLWLTFNSAWYPERIHRVARPYNQMIIGVSDNTKPGDDEGEEYEPEATMGMVARNRSLAGAKPQPREYSENGSGYVRVFDTVSLCTQSNLVMSGNGKLVSVETPNALQDPFDSKNFAYCRSPLDE